MNRGFCCQTVSPSKIESPTQTRALWLDLVYRVSKAAKVELAVAITIQRSSVSRFLKALIRHRTCIQESLTHLRGAPWCTKLTVQAATILNSRRNKKAITILMKSTKWEWMQDLKAHLRARIYLHSKTPTQRVTSRNWVKHKGAWTCRSCAQKRSQRNPVKCTSTWPVIEWTYSSTSKASLPTQESWRSRQSQATSCKDLISIHRKRIWSTKW